MLKENMVIGLASYAFSGKDTFFNVLNKIYPNSKRFPLASILKFELRDFIRSQYGIDVFNCTYEEKVKIRPFLVLHAKIRREESNNKYFTNYLESFIKEYHLANPTGLAVITDIRHPSDADWLQNELKGILVHIKRYSIDSNKNKIYLKAPNEVEELEDPLLQKRANYKIEWATLEDKSNLSSLEIYAEEFIKWLNR